MRLGARVARTLRGGWICVARAVCVCGVVGTMCFIGIECGRVCGFARVSGILTEDPPSRVSGRVLVGHGMSEWASCHKCGRNTDRICGHTPHPHSPVEDRGYMVAPLAQRVHRELGVTQ
jgi:hypothetical protein